MNKYVTLVRILDAIREEARGTRWSAKYAVDSVESDLIGQARSRAFIHLYLKVMFGLSDFSGREQFITDGSYDGGVDGYFIDRELRRIYLIQSKFRNTQTNFESTNIRPEELLVMEIDRITSGETVDSAGNDYNGKILGLIRQISEIPDIARYMYHVVILANCEIRREQIRRLTGGYNAEVFDYSRCYAELVFPVLSGTYFRASDLIIQLDLSHKSAGAKTSYSVSTPKYDCEITVLFVPTLEIARIIEKYRNSILEFNPRSYLDFEGQTVNASIRETLLKPNSNEFALMNNGLTILSDETNFNERIGQQNKAQLRLLNPQIINGGQTAYTLGRAFQEDPIGAAEKFADKEVLVKVITLTPKDPQADNAGEQRRLIDEISAATNRQTVVTSADRQSNETVHIAVQKALFERYGLLYERKRGEFSDGVFYGYIDKKNVLERNLFLRIMLATQGKLKRATRKRVFQSHGFTDGELTNPEKLDLFFKGYQVFRALEPRTTESFRRYRDTLAKVFIAVTLYGNSSLDDMLAGLEHDWDVVIERASRRPSLHSMVVVDRETGERRDVFSTEKWISRGALIEDVSSFVRDRRDPRSPSSGVDGVTADAVTAD